MKNKIVFFGTPEFAVPALQALVKEGYDVILAVTQPDEPVGRKQVLTPTPIKVEAKKLKLEVCDNLEALRFKIKELKPDLGVSVAYGRIIPQVILDLFPLGILNIHPSLLPKYRGPSPIQSAILNGGIETGVTIIKLDAKMDHGPKLKAKSLKLKTDDNYLNLSEKLAALGAKMLVETLPNYLSGKIKLEPQDDSQASYCKMITKEDGRIDWRKSAEEIDRQLRAYAPWPGCFSEFVIKGKKIKVKIIIARVDDNAAEVRCVEPLSNKKLPQIGKFGFKNGQLFVQGGHGALLIDKLQPAGKKALSAKEFINGYLKLI